MAVWGEEDRAICEAWMTQSKQVVEGPWCYERVEGAGHWVVLDKYRTINFILRDFLDRDMTSYG